ncbi:hypothetical protein P152DRAFT_346069 [Eremomyces bilateralis CBS 781.70]|uniref:Uncharacterized protein n=1 Tax=Eremomyces bilateralis CBS 781.70 TaxID=1392243 RepID=A0A6G1G3T7_9PEZI|nr:uncharacterized protein P152DRAFT_346069 [Eremomyces bilateralis CBS 781.70]KAF1812678.1 hypothetical protein P152DRAFT_346069 [Eremomyces bilateralis CBS 781.70]
MTAIKRKAVPSATRANIGAFIVRRAQRRLTSTPASQSPPEEISVTSVPLAASRVSMLAAQAQTDGPPPSTPLNRCACVRCQRPFRRSSQGVSSLPTSGDKQLYEDLERRVLEAKMEMAAMIKESPMLADGNGAFVGGPEDVLLNSLDGCLRRVRRLRNPRQPQQRTPSNTFALPIINPIPVTTIPAGDQSTPAAEAAPESNLDTELPSIQSRLGPSHRLMEPSAASSWETPDAHGPAARGQKHDLDGIFGGFAAGACVGVLLVAVLIVLRCMPLPIPEYQI